jgi:hypothetical protein
LSKFGNPWADFASFGVKALGKKSHQFASESPWNDEFFRSEEVKTILKSEDYIKIF